MRQLSLYVVTLLHYPNCVAAILGEDKSCCMMKLSYHAGSEREAREKVKKRFSSQLCYRVIPKDGTVKSNESIEGLTKDNLEVILMNSPHYVIEKVKRFPVKRFRRN